MMASRAIACGFLALAAPWALAFAAATGATPPAIQCSIAVAPSSLPSGGGTIKATASCSPAPTDYTFFVDGLQIAEQASNQITYTVPANTGTAARFYNISVAATSGNDSSNVVSALVVVASPNTFSNLDQHSLTGAWYNPQTSGQGLLVETYVDLIATGQGYFTAGWYTFDVTAAGGQRWYTLQGAANSGTGSTTLDIFQSTGGNFATGPKVIATKVGTAQLTFADCNNASMTFKFNDGRNGTMPLTRAEPNATCSGSGDVGTPGTNALLSGAWYDPAASGQGFFFDINPAINLLFAGWYTYAPNGAATGGGASQRWYTIQDNAFTPGTKSQSGLSIYETTGGTFNAGSVGAGAPVGTASVALVSCTAIEISYAFTAGSNAGLSGSATLSRVVGAPAGCMLQ